MFRLAYVENYFPFFFHDPAGYLKGIQVEAYKSFVKWKRAKLEPVKFSSYGELAISSDFSFIRLVLSLRFAGKTLENGSFTGVLAGLFEGEVEGSVDRSITESRLRNFRMTLPITYKRVRDQCPPTKAPSSRQDAYLTHELKTQALSLRQIIVFSPVTLLALIVLISFSWKRRNVGRNI